MSYQVLARKWRPKTFAQVVGQDHVVTALSNAITAQRLHHAYLFTGTRGVGKTTLARIFAKSLNCESGITVTPCGQCAACQQIDAGRFPDMLELDAASNTGVDNMREVLDNAQYAPVSGRYKVYLIDEVHMLSKGAFNSMLKTLEEPPEHVKFILATTDPQKIPVTVLSRCLQFGLKQMPPALVAQHLANVLQQEGMAADEAALVALGHAAQGSMRDALSLLDQAIAYGDGAVRADVVHAMLGTVSRDYLFRLLDALAQQDGTALMAAADTMQARSVALDAALQELAVMLQRIAVMQLAPQAVPADEPERADIERLAHALDAQTVQLLYQIATTSVRDMEWAPDAYTGFCMALLRMLAFVPGVPQGEAEKKTPAVSLIRQPEPSKQSVQPPSEATAARAASAIEPVPSERCEPIRTAAPEPGQPAKTLSAAYDGDWPNLVGRLKLGGMARMLAQHCEPVADDGGGLVLEVPPAHKHLLDPTFVERLTAALQQEVSGIERVRIRVGEGSGNTPHELVQREKAARQAEAVAAIEQDPVVRACVELFDARIDEASIKPVN